MHYSNITASSNSWNIQNFPPVRLISIKRKIIGVMLFLWAVLYVNATKYADMVDGVLNNAGF
jgi:hypothetical protein